MTFNIVNLNDRKVCDLNSRELGEPTENECDAQAVNQDRVAELAALPNLEYERQRIGVAQDMGVRASALDDAVKAYRRANSPAEGTEEISIFPRREPWPERVEDIGAVLDRASNLILRYMAMEKYWGNVTAVWCLYTYLVHCFNVSPRYAAQSPTPECGKSKLLNLIFSLVRKPLKTSNIQPAGIFRVVELYDPTLIIDEGDAFLHDNEPLRGILNSGHAAGDVVIRVEGDPLTPKTYKVFGACAFGSIKELPGTLQSRCIPNRLRRATKAEAGTKLQFRQDDPPIEAGMIAAEFQRWALDNAARLKGAEPDMRGLFNRQADNWRPLFAIANLAGGEWPARIQSAALKIAGVVDEQPINVELLIDVRRIVLPEVGKPIEFIGSEQLRNILGGLDGGSRPWSDWKGKGKPISAMALAGLLKEFGIHPERDRAGEQRGYYLAHMQDAFGRYLPSQGVKPSEAQQNQAQLEFSKVSETPSSDTLENEENPHEIRVSDTLTACAPDLSPTEEDPADYGVGRLEAMGDDIPDIPGFLDRRAGQ